MQIFETVSDRDAYKKHLLAMGHERFNKLGLGPVCPEMGLVTFPEGNWGRPIVAAMAGEKLILNGESGVGKSTLLKRVTWSLTLKKLRPRGGYIPAMLTKMKSTEMSSYMEWLLDGDVLVLDDLDKIRGTHYEGQSFLAAINHYDVYNKPIVVTMNTNIGPFKDRIIEGGVPRDYADAIVSRLLNRATIHRVEGPDHRGVL